MSINIMALREQFKNNCDDMDEDYRYELAFENVMRETDELSLEDLKAELRQRIFENWDDEDFDARVRREAEHMANTWKDSELLEEIRTYIPELLDNSTSEYIKTYAMVREAFVEGMESAADNISIHDIDEAWAVSYSKYALENSMEDDGGC